MPKPISVLLIFLQYFQGRRLQTKNKTQWWHFKNNLPLYRPFMGNGSIFFLLADLTIDFEFFQLNL